MTPPVLLDAPAAAAVASNPLSPGSAGIAPDPTLAAEFSKLLGAATVATPPGTAAPPGTIPKAADAAIATVGNERDAEPARSAESATILDSVSDPVLCELAAADPSAPAEIDPLALWTNPASATTMVVRDSIRGPFARPEKTAPVPAPPKATSPIEAPVTESAEIAIDESLPLPCGGPPPAPAGRTATKGESSIPETISADVTAISGGATGTDAGETSAGDSEGGEEPPPLIDRDRPDCVLRMKEPPPADLEAPDGGAATKIEARPLDRSERTRIVHEVIDRVARHVDALAVTRSKEPLRIQLEPADLGRIVVEVSRESNSLVADMSASDPRVAQALDRHRSELAAGLAARGHAEARVTVHTATNADLSGFDLRRDGGSQQQNSDAQSQTRHARSAASGTTDGFDRIAPRSRTRLRAAGLDLEI